ncbi:glucans biosynthesis glucosyltransferase MdoH [Azospirillum sp. RWY-5-1]|uniref:Glucans biosynthesis glucosyltransferase H n=1 Tax=Azospirillum oleiclasticum TaxID=2735135 RepID=A0ABX2T8H4_9PROT|nr:glucans biosynthesis glucosyltransferase MdoH [Azospirillum oleiclasticum]NYZ12348.1 glucans biosynthesis glucosyltransferase MdoH [Azospirillum oleiclasticum]NYZ19508.1 glucans biosynthesis glucosyltransferase MdoH [Azospirillum oleiclasticum]
MTTSAASDCPNPEAAPVEGLAGRRLLVAGLALAGAAGLGWAMAALLATNGWHWLEVLVLLLFLASLPWTLLGFWNSVIGFVILRLARDPVGLTCPAVRRAGAEEPVTERTAVAVCIRHEDPQRVFRRVATMLESLEATGHAGMFEFHILSDSARPEIAAAEGAGFARLLGRPGWEGRLHYRRRGQNTGFKAGNLREFVERVRGRIPFMIVLDADSLMTGEAMVRLVRVMQANPRLGILQTLVVGRPAESAFARVFQFGMRHGMRTHTTGIAWWQGDSGPYWGHNAIIRVEPFARHCHLAPLPGSPPLGGPVLSHDQVEAALMRAAGWEVRVIPEETGSWEENPPSLPDFVKRDLRWCQGNMQYLRIVGRPGLLPMGRFQLVNAMLMYAGAPLWMLMMAAGLGLAVVTQPGGGEPFPFGLAVGLYAGVLAIGQAPRILGVLDVLLRPEERRRYGGTGRLLAGWLVETLFSFIVGPLMIVAQTVFLAGLALGRRVAWEAQNRDGHAVPAGEAARGLWPQMLFGLLFGGALWALAPGALPWASPTLVACALAVPFTALTAGPRLARAMRRTGLCAVPDEIEPAPELRRLESAEDPEPATPVPAATPSFAS